jgi:hypothetical protein
VPELQAFPVITKSGRKGRVYRASRFLDRGDSRVHLDDGSEFSVPAGSLRVQPDGSFFLDDDGIGAGPVEQAPPPPPDESVAQQAAPVEAPSAAAQAPPAPRRPSGATPVSVDIDEPLFTDDVSVERVPVNRIVDAVPETRQEGDVTIIPVIEEVITVEKRLLLREEVRIRRSRTEVHQPRTVVVSDRRRVVGADGRDVEVKRDVGA